MKKILLAITIVTSFIFNSCQTSNENISTPQQLGEKAFEYIKNRDLDGLYSLIPSESEYEKVVYKLTGYETSQENLNEWDREFLQAMTIELHNDYKKELSQIFNGRDKENKKIINSWKDIRLLEVITSDNKINHSEIFMLSLSGGHAINLGECVQIGDTWYLVKAKLDVDEVDVGLQ